MLEKAKSILMVLELTEFKWTIIDVLEQPEEELNAVMHLKATGEKIRKQNSASKDESREVI